MMEGFGTKIFDESQHERVTDIRDLNAHWDSNVDIHLHSDN